MSVALTRLRFTNAVRCYVSYALSLLGKVRISHMPLFVSVEPAAVCQLSCPACPVGQRRLNHQSPINTHHSPFMPREVWKRVLHETASYAHTMQFYFQGEPLLNSDLPRMISEAHACGLYTIVSTNAQAMTPKWAEALISSGLSRIIVSMDGLSEASYGAYRIGGRVEQCKAALRWLAEAKQRLHGRTTIVLQCLRLRTNEHEWDALSQLYRSLGADRLELKTAQLYDYANGHPLMPTKSRYCRYRRGEDGRYQRKPLRRGCLRVWSGCVVTTTGDVLPCCYDKDHAHAYGNIMSAPLRELYSNPSALAFRRDALREQHQICQECWK